jgi:hypothetical protein
MDMMAAFKRYSPSFAGPVPVEDSAKSVLALLNKASIEAGYAGAFLSHTEKKPYL